MKKQVPKKVFFIIIILSLFTDCTKDVDFDQINDAQVSPVLESSLFHFDGEAKDVFVGGSGELSYEDFVEIDVFNNRLMTDYLQKAELEFEVVNSVNRAFEMNIDFLDASGTLRHSFSFQAEASSLNEEFTTSYIEEFQEEELEALKATSILIFKLTMLSGETITPNSPGNISLKSKGVFYLNIEA